MGAIAGPIAGPCQPARILLWGASLLLVSFSSLIVDVRGKDACGSTEMTLASVRARVAFTDCHVVWAEYNYILRYQQDDSNETLNVILSTPKGSRWYGAGFNSHNRMVGTHAIIFYEPGSGTGTGSPIAIERYLSSKVLSGVVIDSTNSALSYTVQPTLTVSSDTYYLSYVVKKLSSVSTFNYMILSIGNSGDTPDANFDNAHEHQATAIVSVDYASGTITLVSPPSHTKETTHGALGILGWGVLLPIGMIIARYCRIFDSFWFYAHAVFQVVGYMFVVTSFGLGLNIYSANPGAPDRDKHRALGIVLFVLASVQVAAGLFRPHKDAKVRRYWNWGHSWLGRSALLLGAVNIFLGIHVAMATKAWKVAYGVILAIEIALIIPLEILYWVKLRKDVKERNNFL